MLALQNEKAAGKPAAFASQNPRLLVRRPASAADRERAAIVAFGDLVIAEAEHLAQDLVGVLTEQRRPTAAKLTIDPDRAVRL